MPSTGRVLQAECDSLPRDRCKGRDVRLFGRLRIDADLGSVSLDGEARDLTRSEFDILLRLTAEPGRVFTREQLLESVQASEAAFERAIDTHIGNLRRKIGDDPLAPRSLKTVWGVGYRFEPR